MQKYSRLTLFIFLVFHSLTTSVLAAEAKFFTRIATVDVRFLLKESPQSLVENEKLRKRFLHREKELESEMASIQQLDKKLREAANLNKDEQMKQQRDIRDKRRSYNRVFEDYREELHFERNKALKEVQEIVFQAIDSVREKEGIDIVIQDYVSSSKRINITEKVMIYLGGLLKESKTK